MLKYGKEYVDVGKDDYEQQYLDRARKNLEKRAAAFDLRLVPTGDAAWWFLESRVRFRFTRQCQRTAGASR